MAEQCVAREYDEWQKLQLGGETETRCFQGRGDERALEENTVSSDGCDLFGYGFTRREIEVLECCSVQKQINSVAWRCCDAGIEGFMHE